MSDVPSLESSETAFNHLVEDYAKYLAFPQLTTDKVANITETIDKMLAQLDEFNVLLESSKVNGEAMKAVLPNLVAQSKQIEKTFAFVDGIGQYVALVDKSVTQLEQRVEQAEDLYGSSITKKIFTVIPGLKKETPAEPVETTPVRVDFVNSAEYFTELRTKLKQ